MTNKQDTKLQEIYNKFQKMDKLDDLHKHVDFFESTMGYNEMMSLVDDFLYYLLNDVIDFNIDNLNNYVFEYSDLNIDDYYPDLAEWIGNNWRRFFIIDQCIDESLHDRKKDILWLVQMAQSKENNLVLNGLACWIEEQYKEYEREEEEDEVGK